MEGNEARRVIWLLQSSRKSVKIENLDEERMRIVFYTNILYLNVKRNYWSLCFEFISLVFVMVWFLSFPVLFYSFTFLCLLRLPVPVLLPTPVSHRLVSTSLFPRSLHLHLLPLVSLVCVRARVVLSLFAGLLCFRPRVSPMFRLVWLSRLSSDFVLLLYFPLPALVKHLSILSY